MLTPDQRDQLLDEFVFQTVYDMTINELASLAAGAIRDGLKEQSDQEFLQLVRETAPHLLEQITPKGFAPNQHGETTRQVGRQDLRSASKPYERGA